MDYSQLPVEERIEKAAEYCLLLEEDDFPQADKLNQLSSMFILTQEQAEKAYLLMRERYKNEYKTSANRKLTNGWVLLIVTGMITVFYAFLAQELGVLFYILAAFFAFSAIALIVQLVGIYRGKKMSPEKMLWWQRAFSRTSNHAEMPEWFDKVVGIPLFFFLFTVVMLVNYLSHPKYIDERKLKVVENLTLISEIYKESDGGKHPDRYYVFHFAGYPHDFRLKDDYYDYGEWKLSPSDFSYRDRITIQLKPAQAEKMQNGNEKKNIQIVNIFYKGRWLVNHEYRNKQTSNEDKRVFYLFAGGFILSCAGIWLWLRFKKVS